MRFKNELADLEKVSKIGDKWGYGNCIQFLKLSWAKNLVRYGLPASTAWTAAGGAERELDFFKGWLENEGKALRIKEILGDE